ncbi:MAG: sugar phosphate isomerase/epimerase [Alphaproteobacteria bacterium]
MLQVGIFTGYFPYTLEETAKRIASHGFTTVQLDLSFKDMDLATDQITKAKCRKIRDTFRDHNLPICCISGYSNIVSPDPDKRKAILERLKVQLRHARDLGTPYVISETGTYDTESDWVAHPKNKTEAGYEDCCKVIGELAKEAHDHGARFLLETYVNNVIGSVQETLRLFADVNHPGLGLLMDPTNYFEDHNIDDMDGELNRIFDALSDKICIAHAKDVMRSGGSTEEKHADIDASEAHSFRGVGAIELPAPGLGSLNYNLYLERLSEHHPNIPIIIEHLDEADVPRAKSFLDGKCKEVGV